MRKFISALVFGALLLPANGFTLGLGDIEVNSSLNQQLNAKIELLSSIPEDADTLIVKLASREEFARAGLDRPYSLTSLKFKAVVEGGGVYIKVTTPKPIREPFLNFLVEVDWPKGHLLREYTILLDPPVFMGSTGAATVSPVAESSRPAVQAASTDAPAPAQSFNKAVKPEGFRSVATSSSPVVAPVVVAPVVVAPAQAVAEEAAPAPVQSQTYVPAPIVQQTNPSGDYRVQAGDTAWSLADSMRPDQSVSVQQMLLAMLRTNPEVFIEGNVNGLKKGYILRIPDRAEITSVTAEEARALISEQNALWREYQQAQSVDQPASSLDVESDEVLEGGSGIPSSGESRLSIVSAGDGEGASSETKDPTEMTAAELRAELALAREQLETERVENEGLEGNVGNLENRIEKMQSLLQIEDESMADLQATAEGEEEVIDEEVAGTEEEMSSEEDAALAALDELTGDTEVVLEEDELIVEEEGAEGEEIFIVEEAESEIVTDVEEIVVEPVVPASAAPRQPQGLVASLLGNRLVMAGVLVLVLVLVAVAYLLIKRRRDSAGTEAEATLAADIEQGMDDGLEDLADSIDDSVDDVAAAEEVEDSVAESEDKADAEEEDFDSEATMILPSVEDTVVTPAATEAVAEEDRDDVIAEADVYLAYGIYQQAEELLQTAISDNPDKESYKVKLAETYFAGKNAESFAALGKEMHAKLAGEDTPAWQKVAAMGKELCPDEEIFQQAGMVADLDMDDLMPKTPEPMDFDLGDDSGGDVLDLDFGDDAGSDVSVDETIAIPGVEETAIIPETEEAAADDGLEFDMDEAEAVEEPEAAAEEEFSLDIEASELDIKDEPEEAPVEEDSVEIDSSELDFDMDLEGDETASPEAAAPATDDSSDVDLSDLGDVDEINTKLDLAKAYMDMGDHEGARDILEEVVAGGNDEQKKEAQELIGQVG